MTQTPEVMQLADIRLSELEFWQRPLSERENAFALLRKLSAPVFFPEPVQSIAPVGPGYYALVRHADVLEASRRPADFRSTPIATRIEDMQPAFAEYFGSLINMDDPRHAQIRKIISRAFTPRMISRFQTQVQTVATEIVQDLTDRGPCDFVSHVASRLPLKVICDMMGIPEQERDTVFRLSNLIVGGDDPEFAPAGEQQWAGELLAAGQTLQELVAELSRHRRDHPADDLVTALCTANIDNEQLSIEELGSFFILLIVAGNETTRNAIAHGLILLSEHEDQRALLTADLENRISGAVEEIIRYSSPITWMRRTVDHDTELNGLPVKSGDKLVLYYWSANRDEAVFPDALSFDITRDPNPHIAFGGPGPHFCLGAHLARQEMITIFRQLLERFPQIRAAGPPDRLVASFVNGIKRLPCEF
jgi:cytochrome P450